MSDEITARGGTVVNVVDRIPFVPDVIHAHHNGREPSALHFPDAPLLFVCHDRNASTDMASGLPAVREYIALDLDCRERHIAEGVRADSVHVITNAVDIDRLVIRGAVSTPPVTAAVFSNSGVRVRPGRARSRVTRVGPYQLLQSPFSSVLAGGPMRDGQLCVVREPMPGLASGDAEVVTGSRLVVHAGKCPGLNVVSKQC